MKLVFLIEGAKGVQQHANSDFSQVKDQQPELYFLSELAKLNNCDFFDPIVSMDVQHITYAFSKFPPTQHERVAHVILDFFRSKTPLDIIILKLFILPAYQNYMKEKGIRLMPAWLTTMQQSDNEAIAAQKTKMMKSLYSEKYSSPEAGYQKETALILAWFNKTSNSLSLSALQQYLAEHPEITHVVGLIGLSHLSFADSLGKVFDAPFSKIVTMEKDNRSVNITLYGGVHGNLSAYQMLASYVNKLHGLKLPVLQQNQTELSADMQSLLQHAQPTLAYQFERLNINETPQQAQIQEENSELRKKSSLG
ncbi:MAG: hypothetical protein BGO43_09590 [Gammaproteobacteria bacterium 39-13]|nr:hypothetical protein [Gammaproteobacteria bacterium]OJV93893.1 MAG: hypothetical protein BGO43_09590 [Gammaproteobacteria bacterium 39-13]